MDLDFVSVHKHAKKERGQYPTILTEQTWSIKDLLYGFPGNFSCGIQRVVPSGQDGSILPVRVANHSARLGSSCPLADWSVLVIRQLLKTIVKVTGFNRKIYHQNLKNTKNALISRPCTACRDHLKVIPAIIQRIQK